MCILTGMVIAYAILVFFSGKAKGQNLSEPDFEKVHEASMSNLFVPDGNPIQLIVAEFTPEMIHAIVKDSADSIIDEMNGSGDTLSFLLLLDNKQYPCVAPVILGTGKQIISQSFMPCEDFYIGDIQDKLYLENEKGNRIKPFYIWGRRHDYLTTEETMIAKFRVGIKGWRWTEHSSEINLVLDGKYKIKLQVKE